MFIFLRNTNVLVIGAGHAGVEAALAAARMGCQTLLLSINLDTIGQMSLQPGHWWVGERTFGARD